MEPGMALYRMLTVVRVSQGGIDHGFLLQPLRDLVTR
jgi:hypothetical protein